MVIYEDRRRGTGHGATDLTTTRRSLDTAGAEGDHPSNGSYLLGIGPRTIGSSATLAALLHAEVVGGPDSWQPWRRGSTCPPRAAA